MNNSALPNNKLRLILNDTIPYEIPFIINNDGLYQFLTNHKNEQFYNIFRSSHVEDYYIPFDFKINKDGIKTRVLSILHPKSQIKR